MCIRRIVSASVSSYTARPPRCGKCSGVLRGDAVPGVAHDCRPPSQLDDSAMMAVGRNTIAGQRSSRGNRHKSLALQARSSRLGSAFIGPAGPWPSPSE